MSTEMTKSDPYAAASLAERQHYVSAIAQAGDLLPRSLWAPVYNQDGTAAGLAPSPAKVLLLAETGAMLGLHPMAALQGIHIIDGKPTLSANLLAAIVRRAGHRLRVSSTGDWAAGTYVARAVLVRSDDPEFEFIAEWGNERAARAGLTSKKGPWSQYPEAMSKARAITEVIREGAPDVTIIAAYTPEEMGASNVTESGEVVEMTAEPERSESGRKRSPGIADLDVPPEPQPSGGGAPSQALGGGFMDADLVSAAQQEPAPPAEPAPPVVEPVPPADEPVQGEMMEEPGAAAEQAQDEAQLTWSAALATLCEDTDLDEYKLRVFYDTALAGGAMGERVPWSKAGTLEETVFAIRDNLTAGRDALAGVTL